MSRMYRQVTQVDSKSLGLASKSVEVVAVDPTWLDSSWGFATRVDSMRLTSASSALKEARVDQAPQTLPRKRNTRQHSAHARLAIPMPQCRHLSADIKLLLTWADHLVQFMLCSREIRSDNSYRLLSKVRVPKPTANFLGFNTLNGALRAIFRDGYNAQGDAEQYGLSFENTTLGGKVDFDKFETILKTHLPKPSHLEKASVVGSKIEAMESPLFLLPGQTISFSGGGDERAGKHAVQQATVDHLDDKKRLIYALAQAFFKPFPSSSWAGSWTSKPYFCGAVAGRRVLGAASGGEGTGSGGRLSLAAARRAAARGRWRRDVRPCPKRLQIELGVVAGIRVAPVHIVAVQRIEFATGLKDLPLCLCETWNRGINKETHAYLRILSQPHQGDRRRFIVLGEIKRGVGDEALGPARPESPGLGPTWEGLGFQFSKPKPKPWGRAWPGSAWAQAEAFVDVEKVPIIPVDEGTKYVGQEAPQ
ncbi:hypothetical protein B0H14DRAFT_2601604 [Mycena olivaceomarginata]|nr:hypothetical protein B0H14DRAFT_2601604 [Mycena olivaceomarginata]